MSNIIPFIIPDAPVAESTSFPYLEGSVVHSSWGYDQTNIDFYRITKRKGDWLTLTPLISLTEYNQQSMTGTCTPGFADPTKKAIRRMICRRDKEEIGCKFKSYGWIQSWDGKPMGYSTYG